MLSEIYRKIDTADKKRQKANKINNQADSIEAEACNRFNQKIHIEHIQQLCKAVDHRGCKSEKEEMKALLDKKQNEDLDIQDLKKYKILEEKYGESLDYNKSFIDRFLENMGD